MYKRSEMITIAMQPPELWGNTNFLNLQVFEDKEVKTIINQSLPSFFVKSINPVEEEIKN